MAAGRACDEVSLLSGCGELGAWATPHSSLRIPCRIAPDSESRSCSSASGASSPHVNSGCSRGAAGYEEPKPTCPLAASPLPSCAASSRRTPAMVTALLLLLLPRALLSAGAPAASPWPSCCSRRGAAGAVPPLSRPPLIVAPACCAGWREVPGAKASVVVLRLPAPAPLAPAVPPTAAGPLGWQKLTAFPNGRRGCWCGSSSGLPLLPGRGRSAPATIARPDSAAAAEAASCRLAGGDAYAGCCSPLLPAPVCKAATAPGAMPAGSWP